MRSKKRTDRLIKYHRASGNHILSRQSLPVKHQIWFKPLADEVLTAGQMQVKSMLQRVIDDYALPRNR